MAIVKMKKVSLVVLDSERKESLKQLRKAGVVHLEAVEGQGAVLQAFKESATETEKALSILEEVKAPKGVVVNQCSLEKEEIKDKAKEIVSLTDRKKSLLDSINQDKQELDRLKLWGAVSPEDLEKLTEKGIYLYMYEIPEDKYGLIGDDVSTILVNKLNKIVRFLHTSDVEVTERPAALPPEAYAVPLPRASTVQIEEDIRKAYQEIANIERQLLDNKKYSGALKDYRKDLAKDIEFETYYSGMNREEAGDENDESIKLAWLTGYVPVDSMEKFKAVCSENQWAYGCCDPDDDDPVPTKLKNNKLVSLIYPLMDFLDVTPGYREFDISSWFLLFFSIFFAMIFGDACYGALIFIIGIILVIKGAKKGKAGSPINMLVLLLGMCTTVWGVMTCSWFGIDGSKLPKELIYMSFTPFSKYKYALVNGLPFDSVIADDYANLNQKVLCFVLALVQLSVAHIKSFFRNHKSLKCLGDLGALLELWGMFYVVMSMVGNPEAFPLAYSAETAGVMIMVGPVPLSYLCIGMLGIGFVLNFIFSNYEGSVGKSILESLKNIISVLLGVVNVFSDTVSYIRLWAVALAGAAISTTINSMAGPMFGKLYLVLFGVILFVFGHGLNIILNLLSVIVHGVRLNTLEFSQHLGMAWSGTKYKPFSDEE